jgi:aspartyl-tRNA(Asn)/glutamyl-tRNA(Gln) amidotransferase subunit C
MFGLRYIFDFGRLNSIIYCLASGFMSEITPDLVRHLANLARIDVNDQEVELFAEQISLIVDSMATVKAAVQGDVPATSHPIPMSNVFREDVVEPSLTQAEALSGSADSGDGRFRVHAILDGE